MTRICISPSSSFSSYRNKPANRKTRTYQNKERKPIPTKPYCGGNEKNGVPICDKISNLFFCHKSVTKLFFLKSVTNLWHFFKFQILSQICDRNYHFRKLSQNTASGFVISSNQIVTILILFKFPSTSTVSNTAPGENRSTQPYKPDKSDIPAEQDRWGYFSKDVIAFILYSYETGRPYLNPIKTKFCPLVCTRNNSVWKVKTIESIWKIALSDNDWVNKLAAWTKWVFWFFWF